MDITIEQLEDNKIKAQVTVPASEVDAKLKKTYKDFANRYNFPGFRKGKAPRPVIDNALGREAILASVTEDVINEAYPLVIEDKKLYPAGAPDFSDSGAMVESGKPFTFEFTLSTKPSFELSSYEPVEVEVPTAGVSDEEIDEQIKAILAHYKDYHDAPANTKFNDDRAASLNINVKAEDGSEIESAAKDDYLFIMGSGLYPEVFTEEVKGIKKGEERSFEVEIPEDDTSVYGSEFAGQKVTFDVKCNVVKTMGEPKLTDEWVKEVLQFDSVEALKEEVRTSMAAQKETMIPRIKENGAADELSKRLDAEVPENVVEQIESELLQDFFTQLQQRGLTFDSYLNNLGIDNNQFKADIKKQAEEQAKQEMALDAWAAHFGIEATDEDVHAEFIKAGVANPEDLEDQWKKQGRLYLIREGINRAKAMDDILEKAIVKEVDFKEKAAQNDSEKEK